MISHTSEDRSGVSEALEFAETLASAVGHVNEYPQRRALTRYLGLEGDEPWTLQAIADRSRVSRQAVRQRRDNAVSALVHRAPSIARTGSCGVLAERARALAHG